MIAGKRALADLSQLANMWGSSINRVIILLLLGTFVLAVRGEFCVHLCIGMTFSLLKTALVSSIVALLLSCISTNSEDEFQSVNFSSTGIFSK